jgi:hypothetical protein
VTLAYTVGKIEVFLNGTLLMPGDDYTASNGTSVVLVSAATVGDALAVVAFDVFNVANTYTTSQIDAKVQPRGGGSDLVFFENDITVTTNYTITTNKNAVTAGPVTINSGATVTVPSGSSWVVV